MSAASSSIPEPGRTAGADRETPGTTGSSRARAAAQWIVVALGVGMIVLLLQRIGWTFIVECAGRLGLSGFALVAALAACESISDALSLRAATLDRITSGRAVLANQAGALVNQFLPGEAGEVWKATLLRRHAGEAGVPATLIWNYAFKLTRPIAALGAALLAWVFGEPDRRTFATLVLGATALSFLPYVGLRLLMRHGLATLATGVLTRVPIVRRWVGEKLVDRARQIDHTVRSFAWQHTRAYVRVLSWQLVARGCSFACGLAALWLLAGFSLPLVALLYAATNAVNYVLLLLPTRVGTTEGATFLLFHLMKLDGGLGLVYSVLMRVLRLVGASPGVLSFVAPRSTT